MNLALHTLSNATRGRKARKLLGRGPGSGKGKTSGRGQKGMGARSGCKARHGYEGGGVPLHRKVPTRGFSNKRFARKLDAINLELIEKLYEDGETVSLETLREKRFIKGNSYGVKIIGSAKLTKKLTFQVEAMSESVKRQIEK